MKSLFAQIIDSDATPFRPRYKPTPPISVNVSNASLVFWGHELLARQLRELLADAFDKVQ